MQTTYVKLQARLYDCQECGVSHAYGDDDFELHKGMAMQERWIYEEVSE